MTKQQDALRYHRKPRAGKLEVISSKPCSTARDLSLTYTPGVAEVSLAIHKRSEDSYRYTTRGNLVAVASNGTAVLGLGDVGPLAAKPVMEGKAVLFKKFADIDVFDLEIDQKDPKKLVEIIASLQPTFGGINLEDIKAPECFFVEQELTKRLSIPVFHDDQHGTAIIAGAALLNALEIANKEIGNITVAMSGAGAAAQSTMRFFVSLGVKAENIFAANRGGVLYEGRTQGVDASHKIFMRKTPKRTLADIVQKADVFVGLSAAGVLTAEMLKTMAKDPIVFALANPTPEIDYPTAKKARPDAIVATGRSDYPNQVNNVLCFPFIFRGALDVRASCINEEMKIAAARAIAALAKEEVPDTVRLAYSNASFSFGPDYILPKPFDPRVLTRVAPAVAQAAVDTGVAGEPLRDVSTYRDTLKRRVNPARNALQFIYIRARSRSMRIVFPEGDNERVLQAARILVEEGIAQPVLLGDPERIAQVADTMKLTLPPVEIVHHLKQKQQAQKMASELYEARQRKGVTKVQAQHLLRSRDYYAAMMLRRGDVDGLLAGASRSYIDSVRPLLQCVGTREGSRAMAMYMLAFRDGVKFLSDTTLNIDPTAQQLAQIALQTADSVRRNFGIRPRVAMLSFSNFGSSGHASCQKVAEAVQIVKEAQPDLEIDGEMQADVALDEEKRKAHFSFCALKKNANVLVCSNLDSANVAYKLIEKLTSCETVGPILVGMKAAANVCQLHCSVDSIVQLCAITAAKAQSLQENKKSEETLA
ncbi:MAG: NADP-dependent malic enzyme [Myxococcota bacterium]